MSCFDSLFADRRGGSGLVADPQASISGRMASTRQGVGLGSSYRTRRRRGASRPVKDARGRGVRIEQARKDRIASPSAADVRRLHDSRFALHARFTLGERRSRHDVGRRLGRLIFAAERAGFFRIADGPSLARKKIGRGASKDPRPKERRDNSAQRCIIRRSRRRILRRRGAQARGGRLAAFRFEPCLLFSHAKGLTAKRSVTQCDTTRSSS